RRRGRSAHRRGRACNGLPRAYRRAAMGRRRPVDLELSEEQIALRDAVRTMCERKSTPEHVRAMEGDPKGFRDEVWIALRDMGLLELLVGDRLVEEVAVVCAELGRALCPSPYIETAVFGAALLGRADE